jgi:4-alpha-methyl-delta7-sterol-4alpha-methyl oxidase
MVEYLLSAYRDPMFLMFPIYTTILGVFLYLLFALPLSAVAYLDPVWARKYKVSDRPIKVMEYFWKSLACLLGHNVILLAILTMAWPAVRLLGVHAGPMPPWWLVIGQILIFLYVDDFLTYWAHKALHKGWFFKKIHSIHHRVSHPSAMDNAYFHFAEFFILMGTGQVAPLLMGANIYVIWIWLAIRIWQSVAGHCGYAFPWDPVRLVPLYEGGDYHYFHHIDARGNISGILPYLDRIWGAVAPKYAIYKGARLGGKRRFLKLRWSTPQAVAGREPASQGE